MGRRFPLEARVKLISCQMATLPGKGLKQLGFNPVPAGFVGGFTLTSKIV